MKKSTENRKMFSLSYKVFLAAVLISLLPMMIVGTMLFSQSANIVKKNESTAKLNALVHIGTNIQTIAQYVDDLSVLLIQDDSVRGWLHSDNISDEVRDLKRLALEKQLSFCVGNKSYISSISIENLQGEMAFVGISRRTPLDDSVKQDAAAQKGRLTWMTDIEKWRSMNQGQKTIAMVRSVNDIHTNKKLGTLRIEILAQGLSEAMADEIRDEHNVTYMIDQNGNILVSEKTELLGESAPEEIISELGNSNVSTEKEVEGERCMLTMYPLEDSNWTLVNIVPLKYVLSDVIILQRILGVSLLISAVLCWSSAFIFTRICTRPLLALTDRLKVMDMKHIEMIPSNDEVGILVKTYNNMSGYIDQLAEELAKKKIELKEKEFAALQAQINPHSLYNNLDTAFWLSQLESAPKTGEIILAMSRLYRLSLGNVNEIMTVAEELEYLENYLILQKIRLENTIDFQFKVAEEIKSYRMLRFILQPIVENAILHGILPKEAEGTVTIQICAEDQMLLIRVSDDGVGTDCVYLNAVLAEDTDSFAESSCFAIRNVNNRIKMRFGEAYGLSYQTEPDGRTTAVVKLPLIPAE